MSREKLDVDEDKADLGNLVILTKHTTEQEKFYFLHNRNNQNKITPVEISDSFDNFHWVPKLQEVVSGNDNVVIYAQNQELNGIIGLYNCLHREPGGKKVTCVFTLGDAPVFNPENNFYTTQLSKGFSVNIYKNGQWGTYRHLPLEKDIKVTKEHCFANVSVTGDLSSFSWNEGPLSTVNNKSSLDKVLVHVSYKPKCK